jgi:hypothetical protein
MSANEPDDLSELLSPKPGTESDALREEVFRRTARALRARRWVRSAAKCAVAAALLVSAFALGRSSAPRAPDVVPAVLQVEFVAVVVPVPVLPESPEPPPAPRTARSLELDAEQADGMAAARLYREAGDAFLSAESDYANAARCYRLFLARAGDAGSALETGDSWLLVSLKNVAFKEKVNAQDVRD